MKKHTNLPENIERYDTSNDKLWALLALIALVGGFMCLVIEYSGLATKIINYFA